MSSAGVDVCTSMHACMRTQTDACRPQAGRSSTSGYTQAEPRALGSDVIGC